jgi:hypothetical protein
MRTETTSLQPWVLEQVLKCALCYVSPEGDVALCGWHENLAVAARVVDATAGTVVRDTDPLPVRLRHFADRAARCWEGPDADDAIAAILEAADLLDSPTLKRWPHSDECRCDDCKSMAKLLENVPDPLDGDR